MRTTADEIISQLPEDSDLRAAAEVLRDQSCVHFCGTQARMTMPMTVGDTLELAVALGNVIDSAQIVRQHRPTRCYAQTATWRPDLEEKPAVAPAHVDGDGVQVWEPWK